MQDDEKKPDDFLKHHKRKVSNDILGTLVIGALALIGAVVWFLLNWLDV